MKWFKSKKQKRIEELEAELAKIKELAYSNIPRIFDKLNTTNEKIDNIKLVATPYRVERAKTETLCAKFSIPDGYSMPEEDIKARLASELTSAVSNYMITYNRYEPRTMEHEFMAYVKVIVCPDRTFYDNKMIF